MYLLYLSSADGRTIGASCKTVVRVELMSEKNNLVRYYRFRNCGGDQAKLKSTIRFLEDFVIPLQKNDELVDLTIYLDGHELAFDYVAASENDFDGINYPEDWHRLMSVLGKLRLLVFVKEKGVLSISMRGELQQYIESVKSQCACCN